MGISREELYAQVWAEPMTKVAATYEVSSSFLARICTRLGVPRPERGYWAKVAHGKKPKQPPLPAPDPDHELEWSRAGEPVARRPRPLPEPPRRRRRSASSAKTDSTSRLLVTDLLGYFDKVYPGSSFSGAGHLKPYKRLIPDVVVTRACLERALNTLDAFFLECERHGYRLTWASGQEHYVRPELDYRETPTHAFFDRPWSPARPTIVFVGTVAIGLTFYEFTENVDARYVNGAYVRLDALPITKKRSTSSDWTSKHDMPSGRLAVRAYSPYSGTSWQQIWMEAAAGEFLVSCTSIIRGLERAAPVIAKLVAEARQRAELEHQRWEVERKELERQAEQRRQQEAERRRIEARKASRQELIRIVDEWTLARNIEAFFVDANSRAEALTADARDEITERLDRARALLGGTDALARFRGWTPPE